MAYRKELGTGVLLLLSLLQFTQSASIVVGKVAESIADKNMEELVKKALTILMKSTSLVLRNHTGSHSVGCIQEPKEHERLNCTLLSGFSSYLLNASSLNIEKELSNSLRKIGYRVEDQKNAICSESSFENNCKEIFEKNEYSDKNLEKVRSILVLYLQWIVKPME